MAPRESITPPESITLARGKTLGCSVAAPPQSHRGVRRDILFYLRQLPIDGCTHAHSICDFGNDCGQLSNFLFGHRVLDSTRHAIDRRHIYAASLLACCSASCVKRLSVFFSSWRVASSNLTTSFIPSWAAQLFRLPYLAIS